MWLIGLLVACGGSPLDACGRYADAVGACYDALAGDTGTSGWGPEVSCPAELSDDEVAYFECLEDVWAGTECTTAVAALEAAVRAEECGR